ncbi:hypothetical protein EV363DRAFT_214587 [Boletus edulis]|nr:hypothetical protein EV363DRAFT_214587 [Boletus edulis]
MPTASSPDIQCGPDGYPIGYGQHYCQKFSDNRGMFDAQGQQWMINTMHCLQLALVGDAIDATPPASDCQALRDQAFASHAGCYISNGFCTLGVQVWTAVLEIVDIKTLFSSWGAVQIDDPDGGGVRRTLRVHGREGIVLAFDYVCRSEPCWSWQPPRSDGL